MSQLDGVRIAFSLKKPKNISLGSILEKQAAKRPDHPAILFEERIITYRDFNQMANRYSHFFQQRGFRKGDVVALLMDSRPDISWRSPDWLNWCNNIMINNGVGDGSCAHAIIFALPGIYVGNELCCC
jgi:acyl-CoA synthetase (AMP-forming)/AMP-acid ligase II